MDAYMYTHGQELEKEIGLSQADIHARSRRDAMMRADAEKKADR
jgi:hypothetical protein